MFIENIDFFYIDLGHKIKDARKNVGMNQEDLAYQLGLKRSSIANIESGKQRPPIHIIVSVAKILCIEFNYLLSGTITTGKEPKSKENNFDIAWDNIITTTAINTSTKKELKKFFEDL